MRVSFLFALYGISLFVLLVASFVVFAQVQGSYDAYEVSVSESYPSPGAYVDFTIRSNKSFVSSIRSVAWRVDGIERVEYANKMKITEIAGSVPKRISARIHYFDSQGERRFAEVFRWMRPVIFDVLWEADSVVTPLYRGHRLAGPQVPVTFSAKIQYVDQSGVIYTEKDFSFRWMIESRYHDDRGPGVSSVVYEDGGSYTNKHILWYGLRRRLLVVVRLLLRKLLVCLLLSHGCWCIRTLCSMGFLEVKCFLTIFPLGMQRLLLRCIRFTLVNLILQKMRYTINGL